MKKDPNKTACVANAAQSKIVLNQRSTHLKTLQHIKIMQCYLTQDNFLPTLSYLIAVLAESTLEPCKESLHNITNRVIFFA